MANPFFICQRYGLVDSLMSNCCTNDDKLDMRSQFEIFMIMLGLVVLVSSYPSRAQSQTYPGMLDSVHRALTQLRIPGTDHTKDSSPDEVPLTEVVRSGEDTVLLADIRNVTITTPRKFNSADDYAKYYRYKRYAARVYPFAVEAIRIFREAEYVTSTMKKRKRKKYLKNLSAELEKEFETPLKSLSKTQGKILVKMIERELDADLFTLIKMTRGRMKAFYWNQFSKLYGYRLRDGYQEGFNPILDMVLQDLDISYKPTERQDDY